MPVDWEALWKGLNVRQQRVLLAIYERECELSAYYLSAKASNDPLRAGAQWRWIAHNLEGGLYSVLKARWGYGDQGLGSTYAALSTREFILRQYTLQKTILGPVTILWVRLTKTGRKLAGQHSSHASSRPGAWRSELQEKIDALLKTSEGFHAWLLTFPAGNCVGSAFPGSETGNPLACYLYSQGVSSSWVRVGMKTYGIGSSHKTYDLPSWAIRFAEACSVPQEALQRLGAQVRTRRGERGLRELAAELEYLQISPSTIVRVEQGKKTDAGTLRALCVWLGIDPAPVLEVTSRVLETLTREQALQALGPAEVVEAAKSDSA